MNRTRSRSRYPLLVACLLLTGCGGGGGSSDSSGGTTGGTTGGGPPDNTKVPADSRLMPMPDVTFGVGAQSYELHICGTDLRSIKLLPSNIPNYDEVRVTLVNKETGEVLIKDDLARFLKDGNLDFCAVYGIGRAQAQQWANDKPVVITPGLKINGQTVANDNPQVTFTVTYVPQTQPF